MSFLNSFKDMLYHTEGESSEPAKPAVPQAPVSPEQTSQISTPVMFSTGVNQEMVTRIRAAVFERKTAYTQLLDASELLKDVIPDTTMRMKAAFKTSNSGRTVQQIAEAIDVHIQGVDGEELRFKNTITGLAETEIGTRERKAQEISSSVEAAKAEIENLRRRIIEVEANIQAASTEKIRLESEAQAHRVQFEKAAKEFTDAGQFVRAELASGKTAVLSSLS